MVAVIHGDKIIERFDSTVEAQVWLQQHGYDWDEKKGWHKEGYGATVWIRSR